MLSINIRAIRSIVFLTLSHLCSHPISKNQMGFRNHSFYSMNFILTIYLLIGYMRYMENSPFNVIRENSHTTAGDLQDQICRIWHYSRYRSANRSSWTCSLSHGADSVFITTFCNHYLLFFKEWTGL